MVPDDSTTDREIETEPADSDNADVAAASAYVAVGLLADATGPDTYRALDVAEAVDHLEDARKVAPRDSPEAVRVEAALEYLENMTDRSHAERRRRVRDALAELAPVAAGIAGRSAPPSHAGGELRQVDVHLSRATWGEIADATREYHRAGVPPARAYSRAVTDHVRLTPNLIVAGSVVGLDDVEGVPTTDTATDATAVVDGTEGEPVVDLAEVTGDAPLDNTDTDREGDDDREGEGAPHDDRGLEDVELPPGPPQDPPAAPVFYNVPRDAADRAIKRFKRWQENNPMPERTTDLREYIYDEIDEQPVIWIEEEPLTEYAARYVDTLTITPDAEE